ncbi:FCD domain-containing protein [Leptobacterium flavescens]|uniref:FCD domain-containing protein n=1 Tax=Leptobacterium flavescens TaxID=472055 RepID=A0A6P0UMN3_9FLAO|nr:FadR/GntR family transcriptional regulator [Leptobacterium flavescens]NER13720.1 FCD domain-containing protein [Leptobacterium flavescens]
MSDEKDIKKYFSSVGEPLLLSQKIENEIEKAIRSKKLEPGQKLPTENEFCDIFKVSRTAVREAIRKLNARGLVDVRKGSGVYVSEITADDAIRSMNLFLELSPQKDLILQALKARLAFEPEIARIAAKERTEEQLQRLEQNFEELKACPLDNIQKEAEIDSEFHLEIVKAAKNEVIKLMMQPMFSLMSQYKEQIFVKRTDYNLTTEKQLLLRFHGDILKAIREQDGDAAYAVMKEHIEHSEHNFLLDI